MADAAYRAVFLRVHPTGKMVLSLTTEPDGKEPDYAQLVASELGVPAPGLAGAGSGLGLVPAGGGCRSERGFTLKPSGPGMR